MNQMDTRRTNKLNITFQSLYTLLLVIFVSGSVLNEGRPIHLAIVFMGMAVLGFFVAFLIYRINKYSEVLKYYIAALQVVLYLYIMLLGRAEFRFALIMPVLFFLVLYHSAGLIFSMSILVTAVNMLNVYICIFVMQKTGYEDASRYVLQLISIVGSLAAAVVTAWFYNRTHNRSINQANELSQMSLSTIETVANTIDAKDPYTQGHSRRVADYAVLIARQMGYSQEELDNIHYVALLHDVGKIAVPDSVLNKPTRLTNEEFNLMKTHTTVGAEILKDITSVEGVKQGAKYHHERYDGKGYPEGLKGEEIPAIARIISLADAYDAMTSNRVYRKPLPESVVLSEIKNGRGAQFAPEVVDAFLECLENQQILLHTHDYMAPIEMPSNGEKVEQDESKDELTGAYREKYGAAELEKKIATPTGSLVLFNIVGLRRINYELGFRVGDYYIKMVADTLIHSKWKPYTVRFNGNQFICYLEENEKEEIISFMQDSIRRVAALEENDPLMEKALDLNCAAMLVEESAQTLRMHIDKLEKLLYRLKGKEGVYAFYDADADKQHIYDISKDMEMLISSIRNSESDMLSKVMGNPRIEQTMKLIRDNPNEEMGVVLFTIKPMDAAHTISVNLEYAMKVLQEGMEYVIKQRGIVSYYSSLQRMALLYGTAKNGEPWNTYFDTYEKEVLNYFHKNYDRIDIEIGVSYSVIK